jgi:hypothetical protein
MFYSLYVFPNHIYYIENKEVLVIFQTEGQELHLYDVISSNKEVNIAKVIDSIATKDTSKIIFHFTPDEMITDKIEKQFTMEVKYYL